MEEFVRCGRTFRVHKQMRIAASRDGDFINMLTGKYITPHVCRDGYTELRQRHGSHFQGKQSMGAKRLMLELWKPEWMEEAVSLIDGNPSNLNIDNMCIASSRYAAEQVKFIEDAIISDGDFRKFKQSNIWCAKDGRIMRNGKVIDIKNTSLAKKGCRISIYCDGEVFLAANIIYETWRRCYVNEGYHVICRDSNETNLALDNLKLVNDDDFHTWRINKKYLPDKIAERMEIRHKELDMAIYFFATNSFDRYHKYIMNTIYPHLIEYGIYKCQRDKDTTKRAAAEVVSNLYNLMSKGRDIYDYYHLAEKMLWRAFRSTREVLREEQLREAPPIDDRTLFMNMARKYGVIELS